MKSSVLNGECEWRCYEHSQCFILNQIVAQQHKGGRYELSCLHIIIYSCSRGGARQIN